MTAAAPDAIDQAIGATEQPTGPQKVATINANLPSGRPAQIIVPLPLTAQDVGFLAGILADVSHQSLSAQSPEERAAAAARSRLMLPR